MACSQPSTTFHTKSGAGSTPLTMNLFSLKTIKLLLETYGARPQKRLGQNFLTDRKVLAKILLASDLSPQDTVVEVGPGLGVLTKALAEKAKKVIAVEKDPRMVEILTEELKNFSNVDVVHGDILKLDTKYQILNTKYKVVANLPYYITSPVIRKFLEAPHKPKLMVLMVQKEVAQRICTNPPDMSLLAVAVQFYAKPKILSYVSKTSFWPIPKVDSAILKITPITADINADARGFFKIVKAGFKQPRKQLLNNLANGLGVKKEIIVQWLENNHIKPNQRAETLGVETWIRLAKNMKKYTPE
ncbi:MAG: hypothetical protein Greene071421_381 [Parcubacteria group bacterium Greene0714_21]|nr:MAG: hypothetical protein Greene041639_34 [Parcubacteria group bacterium Greene0416_39]TSC98364.1 MAG: hypothetical protein Greene101447_107 [Parcubacteria group bacterium Greene1014_47]TSD04015.1 MAG: hypothetical protein Greene071421_381 [Parcubacteria group bacterium Greene0714_21]